MSTSVSFDGPVKKISSCVRPGVWEVRASARRPVSALIRLDLPTLERPATAISTPRMRRNATAEPAAVVVGMASSGRAGGGNLIGAGNRFAAVFDLGAGERGGGSRRRRLRAPRHGDPLTPPSLFFLVKRFFRASHVRLRLSNSSILAPCLCMITLCWATESVLFQAQ